MRKLIKIARLILASLLPTQTVKKSTVLIVGDIAEINQKNKKDKYFESIEKQLKKENIATQDIRFSSQIKNMFSFFRQDKIFLERCIKPKYFFRKIQISDENNYHKNFSSEGKKEINLYYQAAINILKKIKPHVILLIQHYGIRHAVVCAARKLNIPLIEFQHGNIRDDNIGYYFKEKINLPNYFIVDSEHSKNILKQGVYASDQIIPLGIPRYDKYSTKTKKAELKKKLNIQNKKLLFWPTQTHDTQMNKTGETIQNIKALFSALQKEKEWFLLIKLHPAENQKQSKKLYEKYIKKFNLKHVKVVHSNIIATQTCIQEADAIIIKHSTVGLESFLIGTPIINFELQKSHSLKVFKSVRTKLIINKKEDINKHLKQVLTKGYQQEFQKTREEFLKKRYVNFGSATKESVKFIKHIIYQKHRK